MSSSDNSSTFDPFDQYFTGLAPDGETPVRVPLSFLHEVQVNTVRQGILVGTQVGAAGLLLVCLILITKTDKRRSLIFIFNALALLLVVIRGILEGIIFTGPLYDWYRYWTEDYANIQQALVLSVCAEVTGFLLIVVLELSLVFQVRIVCCALQPVWRYLVNMMNMFVALLVAGARLGLAVLNIHWNILGIQRETDWQFDRINRLASAFYVLFVVGIGISAAIFCTKLGYAIRRRRSMGMTQFGPTQIIFIMGFQTMVAPLVFTIITYFGLKNIQMQSFAPTVVALMSPLSAMWAAANTNNIHIADSDAQHRRTIPIGRKNLASGKAYGATSTNMSDTLIDDASTLATSPSKEADFSKIWQNDLEMQNLGDGVQVVRNYGVRGDQPAASHDLNNSHFENHAERSDPVELSVNRNSSKAD